MTPTASKSNSEFKFEFTINWETLPPGYSWQEAASVAVNSKDEVHVFNRSDHPIIVFDINGNYLRDWGNSSMYPRSHGITFTPDDTMFLVDDDDHTVRKVDENGRVIFTLGTSGHPTDYMSGEPFHRPTDVAIDPKTEDFYVADGYGNRRVAVLDMDPGVMTRYWGAYGNTPHDDPMPAYSPDDPPSQQFRSPVHCAQPSNDGLIYVCDRASDRIQVFQPDGTFVSEAFVAPETLGSGSAWDLAFSHDAEQAFIYLADGGNQKVHVINRETMEGGTEFGDGGRQPGQFYGVHSIAVDSQGNIYTTETYEGKRLQKFVFQGYGSPARDQGVVWPSV